MTRIVLLAAIVLLASLAAAPTLAVSGPGFGAHSGKIGRHYVVDDPFYPGAECKYDGSGNFKSINPRPPIGYAVDATSGTDTGEVGYRTVLQVAPSPTTPDGRWKDIVTSSYTQAGTTDARNVDWPGHKVAKPVSVDPNAYYRMAIQFRWTVNHYARTVGTATHYVVYYDIVPTGGTYRIACPGRQPARGAGTDPSPAAAPNAALKPGAHLLFDNDEYPGAICRYRQSAGRLRLARATVTAPIVYAIDRTSGEDTQKVSWRFRVQYTDSRSPGPSDWKSAGQAAYARAAATDTYNAQWGTRTLKISTPSHLSFRVVVDLRWLSATGTPQVTTTSFVSRYMQKAGAKVLVASGSAFCPGAR